jgi:hypothetical protein
LAGEHVPVEVFNGPDYLSKGTRKSRQVSDLSAADHPDIESNPILINRLSDDEFKKDLIKKNALTIDTRYLFAESSEYQQFEDTLKRLHLDSCIYELPKLECANGTKIGGKEYDISGSDRKKRRDILTPPSDMTGDIDELPDRYIRRIRGGVQLQYIHTFYRSTKDDLRKGACLVVQELYNDLLRAEKGMREDNAIGVATGRALQKYNYLNKTYDAEGLSEVAQDIVGELRDQGLILDRDGRIYARGGLHPQPDLDFG